MQHWRFGSSWSRLLQREGHGPLDVDTTQFGSLWWRDRHPLRVLAGTFLLKFEIQNG